MVPYLVQDRVENYQSSVVHFHNNPALWIHVPKRLLLEYAPTRMLPQIRRLLNEGKVDHTLLTKEDKSLYREVMIHRFYYQQWERYKKWFNKRAISD